MLNFFQKKIRVYLIFYRSFIFLSLSLNVVCLTLFHKYSFSIFTALFWFRMATIAITYYFINGNKKKEYYYYLNLGISKNQLWATVISFDFLLFLFLLILTYKIA
jgi:hypothetical protein